MIDNIRLNFEFTPTDQKQYLESLSDSLHLTLMNRNGDIKGYRGRLYLKKGITNKTNSDGSVGRKLTYIRVTVYVYEDGHVKVATMNSLRKWYSNDQFRFDFTKEEFEKCIAVLAEKFKVSEEVIKSATVTRVEYGAHIVYRPAFRCYYLNINSHRHIPKKMTYGNESLEFVGKYKKVMFYDKVVEEGKKINRYSAKTRKQFLSKTLVLRYEISVIKVSGEKFAKNYMNSVRGILHNWNKMVKAWVKELDNITFSNKMSTKIYDFLEDAQVKELNDYFIYRGIDSIGIEKMNDIMNDRALAQKRSLLAKKYAAIFKKMQDKVEEEDFELLFRDKISERAKSLRA